MSTGRRPMSGADAMWLHADRPNHLMVIDAVMWTDEPLDWDRVAQVWQERVVDEFPVFRQRPVDPRWPWELPHWEDDPDFSLDRHLRRARLPRPGGEAELRTFIEERVSRPLDRDHPLWEAWLVDGYQGGSAMVTRFHHAMADGLALAEVMLSVTDEVPEPVEASTPDDDVRRDLPLVLSALNGVVGLASGAVGLAREALQVGTAMPVLGWQTVRVTQKLLLSALPRTLLSDEPGTEKRLTWTSPRPVEEVKAVGRATGSTVNDVLVSTLAGALGRFLAEHDHVPDNMMTMVPVNTRPPGKPLPRELGNKFALVMLNLPTGQVDPAERLAEVHRRMVAIKHSPETFITSVVAEGIGHLHAVEAPFVDFFAGKAFGVTTNVIGPRRPRYLAGTRIAGVLGWVPGSGGQTLGVAIYTYADTVRIGFKVDAATVPDPDQLVAAFDEEFEALRDAALTARTGA